MTHQRFRIVDGHNEASGLAPITSPDVLRSLGAGEAWWLVHDEGGLEEMVSAVVFGDDGQPTLIAADLAVDEAAAVTDAEAIVRCGEQMLILGSAFVDGDGRLDHRRAFIARFAESSIEVHGDDRGRPTLRGSADVLMLGSAWVERVAAKVQADHELIRPAKPGKRRPGAEELINIEGAAVVDDALVLGLRWPVTVDGHPVMAIIESARPVLESLRWTDETASSLLALPVTVRSIPEAGTVKRPAGIRAMSTGPGVDRAVHVVTGPTERLLIHGGAKAAPLHHLRVDLDTGRSTTLETLEGYRKVEGLAPVSGGRWIYALDDDDAVVLLRSL